MSPRPWLAAAAAALALHTALAAPLPWEPLSWQQALCRANADLLWLLAAAGTAVVAGWRAARTAHAAAIATLLLASYRFAETLLPVFYDKPFEPWIDLREAGALLHLLAQEPLATRLTMLAGAAVGLPALYYGLWRAWRALLSVVHRPRPAAVLWVGALCALAAGWLLRPGRLTEAPPIWRTSMLAALRDDVGAWIGNSGWRVGDRFAAAVAAARQRMHGAATDFAGLERADVFVLSVESYGRSDLANAGLAEWRQWLAEAESELSADGLAACSSWVRPSVRGGGSVMAHAELLTGVEVPDRRYLDRLLVSDAPALPRMLAAQGYETVEVMPAMPRPWPEAAFFGFQRELFQPSLPYRGREYHWGRMPDQWALQYVLDHVVYPADAPLFVHYVSVTSHAPFTMVPPYYSDWRQAAAEGAFDGPPAREFPIRWATYTGHPQLQEAYRASIRYSLRVMFGFARQLRRPALVLVLGDHQPPLPHATAEHARDVPLHAITNRPALVEGLVAKGFRPGLLPDLAQPSMPSTAVLPLLLGAFGAR